MDESALLDLLECPVCLERLDASAKVLPCQHTFCKRCLQGILNSRSELRCPECRTLVDCSVDELPSNILLVRLLDGIKQRPRRPGASGCANGTSGTSSVARAQSSGIQGTPSGQLQRIQAKSPPVRGVPQLPCAKALYNYDGKEPGDLKFSKGDIIILRRQVDENWYHGEINGVHGFFPTNFVQIIKPLPQPPPQCKALYDFEVKDKEADKDCLPFSKDDILTVIRRVDENWAEGMLGDKIGIFPISYVEFNSAAKQLIELDKPSDSGGDSGEGTSAGAQSNGVQKPADAKKNTKKRHSFTSLTMSNKSSQACQNRHSMEISGPVLISSSNPTAAARIGELTGGLSCSAPSQVHISTTGLIVTPPPSSPVTTATTFTFPSETSYPIVPVDGLPPPPPPPPQAPAVGASSSAASALVAGQRPSPGPAEQSAYCRSQQRPTVPRKDDELELRKGEMFLVLERCQDGWFKGTSMHTGKIGVFPGNYMAPVSRTGSSSTQPKVSIAVATQAGRGVTIVSPSSQQKPPGAVAGPDNGKPLTPSPVPTAVVSAAHIQTSNQQAKMLMHMTGQMTVNQARNAVRTAAAHSQERPTAAVTPIQSQSPINYIPSVSVLPHLPVPPQHLSAQPAYAVSSSTARSAVPLSCAATSLTPPNVSAASLEGETPLRPIAMLAVPIAPISALPANSNLANRPDKDNNKKEKKGLLKLLSGASAKRKPRSSPPSSPTLESEQAAAEVLQGAVGPEVSAAVSHGRAVSCPVDSEGASSSAEALHRKSSSLDSSAPIAPPPRQPCSSLSSLQQDSRPIVCERYRVVVSYPPQSEAELELKEGDIVFVHKKREDGWFKGTLQRNGKTGLFPGSFVDSM
ncbi:E3 ubiquitin-protein ligase SH3RF1 isoform X2 [Amia ocellicauda]|uniref:E3 ubiquitin-protein ligase SH3RF1 isoform X2 n=1 Tax=Amia ocellicauda TaxID=2972642 RepID=UPI003464561B